ncbi:MAG: long-chain fatty acid--CoA ligase [Deltaproteobacteria bacterium]|nr:long-chain fatty acid--CoA ligase [Deltaproteobacteria bacterium]
MKKVYHEYNKEFEYFLRTEKHLALMVKNRADRWKDSKIAVRHKPYGAWISYTWADFGEQIDAAARGLLALDVKETEKVGIFSHNRVEWSISDLATLSIRAVSVPIYGTDSQQEANYIIEDARIRILFVENQDQYDKARAILAASAVLEKIIVFDKTVSIDTGEEIMYFTDFLAMGRGCGKEEELEKRLRRLSSDDLATLIYTSGTTGDPKGVMLSHKNILAMMFDPDGHIDLGEKDVNLAFLPLSHVFERAWTYFIFLRSAENHYCHDTKKILEFLKESRPMYMCSVPRMWEKVYATVMEGLSKASPLKKRLFTWAIETGGRVAVRKRDVQPIPLILSAQYALADRLVLKKIRAIFGGRTVFYNVGGAAFSAEIAEFFFKTGVLLLLGYGMTECFPICIANATHNKFGTSGPVLPMVKVRLSDEGEIQAQSPSMMIGYYNKPELTKETFTPDGWIKTGDVGTIDDEGYITITDRIKDLMKTSGGKYIAPQKIEILLNEDLFIEQSAVIGNGRQYVSALIVPAFDQLENYARDHDIPFSTHEDLVTRPEIKDFYRGRIDRQTSSLGQVEKIKKFTLISHEFTQEAREITPTQKIRRKVIDKNYTDFIEAMYAGE